MSSRPHLRGTANAGSGGGNPVASRPIGSAALEPAHSDRSVETERPQHQNAGPHTKRPTSHTSCRGPPLQRVERELRQSRSSSGSVGSSMSRTRSAIASFHGLSFSSACPYGQGTLPALGRLVDNANRRCHGKVDGLRQRAVGQPDADVGAAFLEGHPCTRHTVSSDLIGTKSA